MPPSALQCERRSQAGLRDPALLINRGRRRLPALRSRGQNGELGIGKSYHRDLISLAQRHRCHRRSPALAMQPAGQDPEARPCARNGHSTALFAEECQSFLDNVIAGLGQIGSWIVPIATEPDTNSEQVDVTIPAVFGGEPIQRLRQHARTPHRSERVLSFGRSASPT
jgi:hypothetical protein